jgi:phage terminase small subunit
MFRESLFQDDLWILLVARVGLEPPTHFSAKQRKFMIRYALTGKAGQSAIDAGYSLKDARSRASKMLKNPAIHQEVLRQVGLVQVVLI